MSDINSVFLIGRLTKDMELKYVSSGTACGNFSLAVNKSFKQEGQLKEHCSFFDITVWGKIAESLAPYLLKGKQIAISGELKQDRWTKEGYTKSKIKVIANTIQLLGGNKNNSSGVQQAPPEEEEPTREEPTQYIAGSVDDDFEDSIPF